MERCDQVTDQVNGIKEAIKNNEMIVTKFEMHSYCNRCGWGYSTGPDRAIRSMTQELERLFDYLRIHQDCQRRDP